MRRKRWEADLIAHSVVKTLDKAMGGKQSTAQVPAYQVIDRYLGDD